VTAISGRGVGMDVVRSNVERIGGVVEIDSRLGQGTRMTLRVPLTLTIIPALTVSIDGQHFAIPRSAIEEIVRANGSSVTLERIGGAGVATIRGRRVPEIALANVLGLPSGLKDDERTLVVLRPAGGDVYALAVDKIHDHEELVVKPAAPSVMATGLYAGTTLADDGSPILLFDPAGLAAVGGVRLENQERVARIAGDQQDAANDQHAEVLLFRNLAGCRQAIHLAVVDRIEEVPVEKVAVSAGQIRVQLGEAILPLAGIRSLDELPEGKVRVFRLTDGVHEVGFAFSEVIDQHVLSAEVIAADLPGLVAGVTLLAGEPAELIDSYWLFADLVGTHTARSSVKPRCYIPARDAWMQHMLRPMVESLGYEVVSFIGEGDPAPDLVIQSDAEPEAPVSEGARRLVIRSAPDGGDDSVYRYDRTGLMVALKAAGGAK